MTGDIVGMERAAAAADGRRFFAGLMPGSKAPGEASGRAGLALVAAALIVLFSFLNPSFFRLENFVVIGVNSTSVLIAVLGTSGLLIAGYVDLSIGSMMALIGIIVAKVAVATQDAFLAAVVGLGLGTLLGLLNGFLVRRLSISPLIVTLAMLALYGGLAFVVSSTAVYGFPEALLELGRGKAFGHPVHRDDRCRGLPDRLVRPDPHGHRSSNLCSRRRRSCSRALRHPGRPVGRGPLRRQRLSHRTCRRAGRGPARQHHADDRRHASSSTC